MSVSDEDHTGHVSYRRTEQPRCGTLIRLPEPNIDQKARKRIGRDLRAMYEALLVEPLPVFLVDLVSHLRRTPERTLQ